MTQTIENFTRTMTLNGESTELRFTEVYGCNVFTAVLMNGKADVDNSIMNTRNSVYYICYLAEKEEKTYQIGKTLFNNLKNGTWTEEEAINVFLSL